MFSFPLMQKKIGCIHFVHIQVICFILRHWEIMLKLEQVRYLCIHEFIWMWEIDLFVCIKKCTSHQLKPNPSFPQYVSDYDNSLLVVLWLSGGEESVAGGSAPAGSPAERGLQCADRQLPKPHTVRLYFNLQTQSETKCALLSGWKFGIFLLSA